MSKAWLSVLFVLQLGAGLVLGVASAQQSPPVDVVAPAAMVAAPPVMIAPAASHGLSLPDPFRLDMLIRSTLIALNQANDTGNYTVFRDLGSSAFQGANSAADLAGLFGNLRRQRIDLMPIIFVAPKPTQPPQIDNRGLLRLVGYFPTQPLQVKFDLAYQLAGTDWKLYAISVSPVPAEPAVAQTEQTEPPATPAATRKPVQQTPAQRITRKLKPAVPVAAPAADSGQ
jgi:hypothetical protein